MIQNHIYIYIYKNTINFMLYTTIYCTIVLKKVSQCVTVQIIICFKENFQLLDSSWLIKCENNGQNPGDLRGRILYQSP